MKTGAATSIQTIMLVVAAIIAVAFGVAQAVDWGSNALYGKCWTDTKNSLTNMDSKLSSLTPATTDTTAKVFVGSCVGGVIIFDKGEFNGKTDDFSKFAAQLEQDYCSKYSSYSGYKSYILMLPWKTIKNQVQSDATLWQKIKSYFPWNLLPELYNKYLTRQAILKPECIPLQKQLLGTPYFMPEQLSPTKDGLKALNEQDLQLCYALSKTDSAYSITPTGTAKCPDITN